MVKACGGCHKPDDKQQLSRISFRRSTPEGWERTITRMLSLNGLKIDAPTARAVVKSLSNSHGLAPEEARPVQYESERRLVDESYKSAELDGVCNACHALGRIISQRRSKQDWQLLIAMHRGWYPIIDRQTFRRMGPAPHDRDAEGRLPDLRHPSEKAADFLADTFPLETKEWAEWSTAMRPAKIDGTWALSGWETSKGPIFGRVVLAPVAGSTDEFTTQTTYTYARTGEQVSRAGKVTIYTGFQWRGRSTVGGADASALREVMFVERDWSKIEGRWFAGGYDELGLDVRLDRVGKDLTVAGLDHTALRAGGAGQTVKIYAANAPSSLTPRDLDLGAGVTVTGATVASDVITATVDVAATAANGPRTLIVAGTVKPAAITVYDKVDSIRVTPAVEHGPRGWRGVPEDAGAVRCVGLQQRPGQEARDGRRLEARRRGRDVERRGIQGHARGRGHQIRGHDGRGHGRVHAERRRPESATQGRTQQHGRCMGRGQLHAAGRVGAAQGQVAPARHRAALHEVRSHGNPMNALGVSEFHTFEASGQRFGYMVPSAAVFAFDDCSTAVVELLKTRPHSPDELLAALSGRFGEADVKDAVTELHRIRAIHDLALKTPAPKIIPLKPMPIQTLVINVTNQCNLACEYCYEYGEDKIVDTENGSQPKFMSPETARAAVDLALRESGVGKTAHITFFGGETLMNFKVLKSTVAYARETAAAQQKDVDFSLTTNATLLQPDVIDFLADERIGVTISIDGPQEIQDKFRVFSNGKGSYEIAAPKIKALLARHKTRPIGARVTLTKQTLDVKRIYKHLFEDMGFWEVGFAPVTTAPQRDHALEAGPGYDHLLEQFRALAAEFLEASLQNKHHGFSNVRETLQEIHMGHAKAYPCGAGIGLLGVATDGEVSLCHRFAGSEDHRFGSVTEGIDRAKQASFLDEHHIANKTDCAQCWARPICGGGCYHEAHTRYGDTAQPNLHYCDWIRGWTHTCLEIYGELAVKNPGFLRQFDGDDDEAPQRH